MPSIVEPATKPTAAYHDWTPRYLEVAGSLVEALRPLPEFLAFEHVGSTAIPGCGGKGVIDFVALYQEGNLEKAREFLLAAGFVRQGPEFANPWPDARPMFLGTFILGGERFLIYVHVVHRASDEVRRFRAFRDRLMASPELVEEYCEQKRAILRGEVTDTDLYAIQKRPFIHRVLGRDHGLEPRTK